MNSKNVVIGNYYRLEGSTFAWAKVVAILPPHKDKNTHGYWIAECEWSQHKDATIGMIKYFKLRDLVKEK